MLLREIWNAVKLILDFLTDLLPQSELVLPRYSIELPWPAWIPHEPLLTTAAIVVAWLAVLGAYTVANWVWRHIPTIAGFGTSGG